jgi:hypothetical protein
MEGSRNAMPAMSRVVGTGVSFSAPITLSIGHLPRLVYSPEHPRHKPDTGGIHDREPIFWSARYSFFKEY